MSMKLRGHVAHKGEQRNLYELLDGKPWWKTSRRLDRRWDNIKLKFKDIDWEDLDWINLFQSTDRADGFCEQTSKQSISKKSREFF
jgi:hypothetical protein